MRTNDLPVTDAELDQFYGVPLESDDTPNKVCAAIREIPQALFSPACAKTILDVLAAKVAASNFAHMEMTGVAIESMDDASFILEAMK